MRESKVKNELKRRWLTFPMVAIMGATLVSACMFKDVKKQQAAADAFCLFSGTVAAERETTQPIIVGLVRHTGGDLGVAQNWVLADHFVLEAAGRWMFRANPSPNAYGLVAFVDSNSDGVYQPGEPFLRIEPEKTLHCSTGERKTDLALVIPAQGNARVDVPVSFTNLKAHSPDAQQLISLGQLSVYGKITTIDDAKFTDAVAGDSLWRPYDFIINVGAGVYFLQPYDPAKIPVLFVHGINGHPANFRSLIERLDHKKYQPWVYYYPSGGHLDQIADHLDQVVKSMQVEYGFKKFHVVAHSMGGLVSRGFLLRNQTAQSRAKVLSYTTLSTPWAGHKAAEGGVKYSPAVVRVWNDMVPGSAYIHSLFFTEHDGKQEHQSLPAGLQYHLLFDFKQSGMGVGECNDGTVTVSSQLYAGAQQDAARIHGFDETHMSILDSKEVSALVNRVLDETSR